MITHEQIRAGAEQLDFLAVQGRGCNRNSLSFSKKVKKFCFVGISLIPEMAKKKDKSKQRKYLSLSGVKPIRIIVRETHPQRYQSKIVKEFIASINEWCQQDD